MAKIKPDDEKLKVRTVSLPMDLYERLQPIVDAAVSVGEAEAFVLRQVARTALHRKWTATFLEVPSEVTRERDRDRVTPRLALPPAMDEQVRCPLFGVGSEGQRGFRIPSLRVDLEDRVCLAAVTSALTRAPEPNDHLVRPEMRHSPNGDAAHRHSVEPLAHARFADTQCASDVVHRDGHAFVHRDRLPSFRNIKLHDKIEKVKVTDRTVHARG